MSSDLHVDSMLHAADDCISCDVAGEAVILSVSDGRYFGTDAVGTRVWTLLSQPRRIGEIRDRLTAEFEVEPTRCEADLLRFLEELHGHHLVRVVDAVVE